jgi:nucleotide-binding universal stress UspA family protein
MFRHILAPQYPGMDTPLALEIGGALSHGGEAPVVTVAPLESFGSPEGAAAGVLTRGGAEQPVDLIIVTPKRRELCEIEWYPHTASWALLRYHTPLLFWPPETPASHLLAARRPLFVTPLDGHEHAERAIPYACELAELFNGEVVLLHVVPETYSEQQLKKVAPAIRRARLARVQQIMSYLQTTREAAAARTRAPVSTKLLLGEPGTALVRFAQRQNVGAIVMTTHSQARGKRFFAGAVATQALRQSPAPTLLLPLGVETEASQGFYHAPAIPITP